MIDGRSQSREHTDRQAAIFGVLADPTRLRLVKVLQAQRGRDALCVNALAALLGVSQPAVSQHLRVLKSIGLVRGERRGYHIHYFVNPDALERCRQLASMALSVEASDEQRLCKEHCTERRHQDVSSL